MVYVFVLIYNSMMRKAGYKPHPFCPRGPIFWRLAGLHRKSHLLVRVRRLQVLRAHE